MIFAFPVACLYLPFVVALSRQDKSQLWQLMLGGIVIGPASLAIWGLVLGTRGSPSIWEGDGIGFGLAAALILSLIVGFLTTMFYIIALKIVRRWCRERRTQSGGC